MKNKFSQRRFPVFPARKLFKFDQNDSDINEIFDFQN